MKKINKIVIRLFDYAGKFAENKDVARTIREDHLFPALREGKLVILDYSNVDSTTQSFTHALISELIRIYGEDIFDKISFKNCSEEVKRVIGIVSEYMQKNHE